ncbi:Cys-tRNA(Pro) deacylase [Intrasporangium calvum]|uniref:Cys-tRNA(Pro)/Cys-tRNA(Cys) deacylase n=1 Tax=Intrasporangium calvum TaxID=53358 RepID=A0ABT5GBM6_9MICO|nr:Cys-tRNA(Pro) deacylase [Intrasporangium calvum]MDC5695629.1 Cys-tRNA(Pro) deacylase [Intrasporangium calvum]
MPRQHGGDRTRSAGPATPATAALDRLGIDHRAHTYAHDPAETGYGAEAARELGVTPERIFKTLLVDTGPALAVAVVPVAGQLDLKAMAAALGVKTVHLADAADAERSTGYVIGGISPLGQRRRLATIIDSSALEHDTVYVSGGRRGFQVELSPTELIRATAGSSRPIARA